MPVIQISARELSIICDLALHLIMAFHRAIPIEVFIAMDAPCANMPTAELRSLQSLIRSSASGDRACFSELYDRTHRRVFALLVRTASSLEDAEEALVDTYVQAWRQASRFDPARSSAWGWLMMIAYSRGIDLKRKQGRKRPAFTKEDPFSDCIDPTPSPQEFSVVAERNQRVAIEMHRLPAEQRKPIDLAFFFGLSHAQVALQLNQPLGTIKSRIRSGLSTLRSNLMALNTSPL